jgi:type IV pilus assembly protein PilA
LLKALRNRMQDDKGFTLIELMVVVLIIAILIAIAIPTFLGLRRRAQDRAAQSDLRNGLTAAKAYYTDNETYAGFVADDPANPNDGESIEPSLNWADGGAATQNTVHIKLVEAVGGVAGQAITLATRSESGTAFCIADNSQVGTVRGIVDAGNFAACDAAADW